MSTQSDADDLRSEYDFTPEDFRRGERGRYVGGFAEGANLVPLDPEMAESKLTEEDAAALADEVDRAVWGRLRHRLEER